MGENLIIVESPEKARTIEKFLGKGYKVLASRGHIRDLSKKKLGIDIEHGFEPEYVIPDDKKKIVAGLKAETAKADTVWLASDEDREGEAISWHLAVTLGLNPAKTHRIAFHEITKNAVLEALENPRDIDMNLVMAQQARRVLDRLVGFELSPILWRKIKPALSAGRVQSAALRLIVEREKEIIGFTSKQYYKVESIFSPDGNDAQVNAAISEKIESEAEVEALLENLRNAEFRIGSLEKKEAGRTPASPFTTSLLQQEASRKLGFSVSLTMSVAQRLYEAGKITYMRTDSVNLSKLALAAAKDTVTSLYGAEYSKTRQYRTKSKGAQEAHEAIRPTNLSVRQIEGTTQEKKLYELIWKRTIASQMADARVEKTAVSIISDNCPYPFRAEGTQILFDGFLKVYMESRDDEADEETSGLLPALSLNEKMVPSQITATQKWTSHSPRYTEASLVKRMEELGIGRPSTYAPTITTLHQRGYIVRDNRPGEEKVIETIKLSGGKITKSSKREIIGGEKGKLFPEDIGIMVTDFLQEHFPSILDYGFTAKVEESFDDVATGHRVWNKTIADFYSPFHGTVTDVMESSNPKREERVIGIDPATGKKVIARMGKFGPLVQIGENDDPDKKYASIDKGKLMATITLEDALKLFAFPRVLGTLDGEEIICSKGKFGPYIKYKGAFTSLPKGADPYTFDYDSSVNLIAASAAKKEKKPLLELPEDDIQVLDGRYGPYIKHAGGNYRIPKGTDAAALDRQACLSIIEKTQPTGKKRAEKKNS